MRPLRCKLWRAIFGRRGQSCGRCRGQRRGRRQDRVHRHRDGLRGELVCLRCLVRALDVYNRDVVHAPVVLLFTVAFGLGLLSVRSVRLRAARIAKERRKYLGGMPLAREEEQEAAANVDVRGSSGPSGEKNGSINDMGDLVESAVFSQRFADTAKSVYPVHSCILKCDYKWGGFDGPSVGAVRETRVIAVYK